MRQKKILLAACAAMLVAAAAAAQPVRFDEWFTGGTLRVDCLRAGSAEADTVWVARWEDRLAPWHGSRTRLVDPIDNGDYRVAMRDIETGRELYSRGYSTLFREYKDTPEGRTTAARFEEVLLLPMPRRAVEVALQRRDSTGRLRDATTLLFDPQRTQLRINPHEVERTDIEVNGPAAVKVDVVIVAQGYEPSDTARLQADYRRMAGILFGKEPFKSHRSDFNLYGVRGDAGAEFNTFGIDRYLMTFHLFRLHDLIGDTPCDYIVVMVNSDTYGGGAIYNFYSVSTLHGMAEYVLPHEFGHAFGGLADEYVDEDLSYADLHRTATEPLEPNITNLVDFGRKWQSLLPAGTPVPTPLNPKVPRTECGPVGVYEGAGYSSTGVYRPAMHCMMRDYAPFCPVCRVHLERIFELYTQ